MNFKKWLIVGIVIRLIIIPFTYHPDLQFFILTNYLLVGKHLWLGFYDFLGSSVDPLAQVLPPYAFTYPPLAILSGGLFANVFYRLLDLEFIKSFILYPNSFVGQSNFYWLVLLTKLPYLLIDLLVGYYLSQLINEKYRLKVFAMWMLNPITLYATFSIGQFDIYPTLATILAVWFVLKKRLKFSVIALGIGGAFKLFPLLLLPLVVFQYGKTIKDKIWLTLIGSLAYFLPILLYLPSKGFRSYALLAPQTDKMLFAKIAVSGAEYLSIFIMGYVFLLGLSVIKKIDLWKSFSMILLLFFAVTHYHPQWMLWLSPWLILMWMKEKSLRFSLIIILLAYFVIVLSFEPSLNYGLIFPYSDLPKLVDMLPMGLEKFKYLSLVRSVFAGTSIYMIYVLVRNNKNKT